jgi:hypothetical protein
MSDKQNTNNQITLFETLNKNLVISNKESVRVPSSYIFAQGSIANAKSFGNKTFGENSIEVDKALANVSALENIWNHTHTQWIWKHLNLHYHAPLNNMKQISAEIAAKKNALNDTKWRVLECEMKIKKMEEKLEKGGLEYWEELQLKIDIAKEREALSEAMVYIEGAMKDVLALNSIFEDLKKKINSFSEVDVEREETKSHLRRSIVQCIRDVRQSGFISKGEQEYVENIGVNPSKLQEIIREYVLSEKEAEGWDIRPLFEFVESLSDKLIDVCQVDKVMMDIQGYSKEFIEEFTYTDKLALLENKRDLEK